VLTLVIINVASACGPIGSELAGGLVNRRLTNRLGPMVGVVNNWNLDRGEGLTQGEGHRVGHANVVSAADGRVVGGKEDRADRGRPEGAADALEGR
jgi:hypothetical protein